MHMPGAPALLVNGKYRVMGSNAVPSYQAMLDVVDYLLVMDRTMLTAN